MKVSLPNSAWTVFQHCRVFHTSDHPETPIHYGATATPFRGGIIAGCKACNTLHDFLRAESCDQGQGR